jgi:hypothetical protein
MPMNPTRREATAKARSKGSDVALAHPALENVGLSGEGVECGLRGQRRRGRCLD